MLDGLRAFGRYVPRTLVMRLVKEGRIGSGAEERVLAIMCTDIVSFTSTCERMSAAEVAEFINQHLSLVSLCVEQEGGTIDKFIGDGVMAFWGAPGRVENPAASACRTAVAIQRALAADNKRRVAEGLEPVEQRTERHPGASLLTSPSCRSCRTQQANDESKHEKVPMALDDHRDSRHSEGVSE
jgi:adenylate cyclase